MKQQVDHHKIAPKALKGMFELEKYVANCNLEPSLLELVKLRVSQINGCEYCIEMHSRDARNAGETRQRIEGLGVWRETNFFTKREQAALAWVEALAFIYNTDVSDGVFEQVRNTFSDQEIVALTTASNAVNSWNRLAISFSKISGYYNSEGELKI